MVGLFLDNCLCLTKISRLLSRFASSSSTKVTRRSSLDLILNSLYIQQVSLLSILCSVAKQGMPASKVVTQFCPTFFTEQTFLGNVDSFNIKFLPSRGQVQITHFL